MLNDRARSLVIAITSAAALAASLGTAGCSSETDGSVKGRADVIGRAQSALSGPLTAVQGTYGEACSGRSSDGTDTWTLSIGGGGPAADELSVRKNDSSCVLTITKLVTAEAEYSASAGIVLDQADTFSTERSFKDAPESPIQFYASAKIDDLAFDDDFTISIQISADPSAADAGSQSASYATQSGSVVTSELAASDYTVSFADFSVQKDAAHKVVAVGGFAQLAQGTVTGQHYQVVSGAYDGSSSIDAIEAAFTSPALLSELETLQIPASEFLATDGSVDLDDSPQRTIIIRRTDADSGVKSYQLLLVTFTP